MIIKNIIISFLILFCSLLNAQNEVIVTSTSVQDYIDEQLLLKVEDNDTSAIKRLLKQGARVNTKTYEGVTPLMFAVIFGYYDVANLLLYYGADVNIAPYDGKTPLMEAASHGDIETGEMLIENNADFENLDKNGYGAIHHSVINGQYYFTDMLLYYGYGVGQVTREGATPLMLASYLGDTNIVYLLLDNGAEINFKDKSGFTALMLASQQGFTDIVRILINSAADVNAVNDNGISAVSLAVKNGNKEVVKTLIDAGANYNGAINGGYNLIKIAEKNNHYDIKQLLKEYGLSKNNVFLADRVYINYGVLLNSKNVFWKVKAGVNESRYYAGLALTYYKRFGYIPVLDHQNNILYQLSENRSYIGGALMKQFTVYNITNIRKTGIHIAVEGLYSYGKYRGLNRKPESFVSISPEIGLYYRVGGLCTTLSYKYLKSGHEEINPGYINMDISVDFRFKKQIVKNRTFEW